LPQHQRVTVVTGASGFVGGALLSALAAEPGVAVRGLYRSDPGTGPSGTSAVAVGDLGDAFELADAVTGVDVVIHAAARTHVLQDREAEPLAAYRKTNVAGTMNLARAAAKAGVRRFVYLSSIKVNGERTPIDRPLTEASPPSPEDAYGITKWEAEQALRELSKDTGLEVVVIRPPLVHGAGAKGNLDRLMRLVDRGVPLPLASVRNRRSMIGLDNLVSAIMAAAEHPAAAGKTFLVSDGDELSTPGLIRAIASGLNKSPRLWPCPPGLLAAAGSMLGRRDEVDRLTGSLVVDSSSIRNVLGWEPQTSAVEGVRAMAQAFRGANP
jgi:nucleoside-diphosphate-sugar epimerase